MAIMDDDNEIMSKLASSWGLRLQRVSFKSLHETTMSAKTSLAILNPLITA